MRRRSFIKAAGMGVAATAVAAPALAQSMPEIKWRCASSFPKSLDTIFGAAEIVSKTVAELTDGKFQIRVFAAGEIVPGLQVLDGVQNGTVETGHSASYYYVGKDPTFAFDAGVPFGLTARQQNAWMYYGGGNELFRDFFKQYNIVNFPCGNTGTQMGGWFRKEINSLKDMEGLKFRIGGFAGQVLSKLGVVAQQIPGGDIYPALEKGTIDGAEWVGPFDDEKLGFYKVAKYYYYPGFWEGGTQLTFYINTKAWETLPKLYQDALAIACEKSNLLTMANYDTQNPPALRRLVSQRAVLKAFPREVLEAAYKAAFETYEETAAKNASFKKVYEPWKTFRASAYEWFSVAEHSFDRFTLGQALKR